MTPELKQAIEEVSHYFSNMTRDEFDKVIEEHKGGAIAELFEGTADWVNRMNAFEQDALRYRAFIQVRKDCAKFYSCPECLLSRVCPGNNDNGVLIPTSEQLDKLVAYYKEKGIL